MSIRSMMNNTATVYSVTQTHDRTRGTVLDVSATRYSNMPCRICPVGGGENARYHTIRADATHMMFVESQYSAIAEQDSVVDAAGISYSVVLVKNPSRMGHHFEVELVEERPLAAGQV